MGQKTIDTEEIWKGIDESVGGNEGGLLGVRKRVRQLHLDLLDSEDRRGVSLTQRYWWGDSHNFAFQVDGEGLLARVDSRGQIEQYGEHQVPTTTRLERFRHGELRTVVGWYPVTPEEFAIAYHKAAERQIKAARPMHNNVARLVTSLLDEKETNKP